MGLFGGSTTYVSSTLYNMAGEPLERPNYLKTVVIGSSLVPGGSIAQSITRSYLKGPGIKYRTFFKWAEENYAGIGVPTGNLGGSGALDPAVVAEEIPHTSEETIDILQTDMGLADFSTWVEQWLFENNPSAIGTEYTADIDAAGLITITYVDTTTDSFTPTDFDLDKVYVYAAYTVTSPAPITDPPADPPDPPVTSGTKIFIYQIGSGNVTLDALAVATVDDGEYMPFIPIRLDNQFLSTTYENASYELAGKALKKASLGSLDDMITKLEDNPDLAEIDYAYIMFGVPLNILDTAGKQYLYRFFDKLRTQQTNGNAEWLLYQSGSGEGVAPSNVVQIKSTGVLNTNVNMKITWNSISESSGAGLGWIGAVPGKYKVEKAVVSGSTNVVKIWQQVTDNSWKCLEIIGAIHDNLIYNNKSVTITSTEAMDDPDESGFLVPLHYATLRDMSLKDSTQLGTQTAFLVLNSYKVVKKKWYQTGIFKIFVFVAIIAITVLTAGAGTAPSIGLLGSAAAVGGAIGLTGTLALIAGAVANALAGMLLMKILGMATSAVFGEKWGAIIGSVLSLATMQVGTSLMNGASLASAWGNLMSAQNIIAMTMAAGNGVSGYIMAGAMETIQKTEELIKANDRRELEQNQKFAEDFGYDKAALDPLGLTDATIGNAMETETQFLSRTLMTGTDIAEMTKDMLNNFAAYTLTLNNGRD